MRACATIARNHHQSRGVGSVSENAGIQIIRTTASRPDTQNERADEPEQKDGGR